MSSTASSKNLTPASPSASAQFLSCEDFSQRTGVRERTVRLWCHSGKLPAVRLGKSWLIPARSLADLEALAAAGADGRRQGGGA
jgi:excisionase family DNA binding protein